MRCEKDRGKVKQRESFKYKKCQNAEYHELIASIKRVSKTEASAARHAARKAETLAKYEDENDFLMACLDDREPLSQSEIIEEWNAKRESLSFGRCKLITAIKKLSGVSIVAVKSGHKNTKRIWRITSKGWRDVRDE